MIGTCLKRQIYSPCVLPAMTYGAETWTLTTYAKKQASSRTNNGGKGYVKHQIPGQKKIIWVREKTKVTDVVEQVNRRKWTWAGHVSRIRDNR